MRCFDRSTWVCIVIAVVHWKILDRTSGLDRTSDIMAPMYLKLVTVLSFWLLALISL